MTANIMLRSVRLLAIVLIQLSRTCVAQEGSFAWDASRVMAEGVRYAHASTTVPRKMVVHCLRVDLTTSGIEFHTTDRRNEWEMGKSETNRQTTRSFLRGLRKHNIPAVVAINADAFSPWPAPYAEETETDLLGLAVSHGTVVSSASGTPSLVVTNNKELRIDSDVDQEELKQVETAISGFGLCLSDGKPTTAGDDIHPRTAVGLSSDNRQLYLLVIDGRQPTSIGATVQETGAWLLHFGAFQGINLDGGGSATMAYWNPDSQAEDKCELLNQPVGDSRNAAFLPRALFKPSERANGNNFAISIQKP